jgi:hypothetical protein
MRGARLRCVSQAAGLSKRVNDAIGRIPALTVTQPHLLSRVLGTASTWLDVFEDIGKRQSLLVGKLLSFCLLELESLSVLQNASSRH